MTYSGILLFYNINLHCRRKSLIERRYCNAHNYTCAGAYESIVQTRSMFNLKYFIKATIYVTY